MIVLVLRNAIIVLIYVIFWLARVIVGASRITTKMEIILMEVNINSKGANKVKKLMISITLSMMKTIKMDTMANQAWKMKERMGEIIRM